MMQKLVSNTEFYKTKHDAVKRIAPIFGHYEIIKKITSGGMGTVYKSRHEDSRRHCRIKGVA